MLRRIAARELPYRLLVTSNYVVDELATRVLYERGHHDAVWILGKVRHDPAIRILHVTGEIDEKADVEFARYKDQEISYTDCTSKVMMMEHGIQAAFSFDRDFETMGFVRLP